MTNDQRAKLISMLQEFSGKRDPEAKLMLRNLESKILDFHDAKISYNFLKICEGDANFSAHLKVIADNVKKYPQFITILMDAYIFEHKKNIMKTQDINLVISLVDKYSNSVLDRLTLLRDLHYIMDENILNRFVTFILKNGRNCHIEELENISINIKRIMDEQNKMQQYCEIEDYIRKLQSNTSQS